MKKSAHYKCADFFIWADSRMRSSTRLGVE